MSNKVYVVGVGLTKFEKPGRREGWDYPDMARESGTAALADAGITYDQVQQAYVGYCTGDSCSGHRAVYELGLTGLPVFKVNSNCSTGSSALFGQPLEHLAGDADRRRRGALLDEVQCDRTVPRFIRVLGRQDRVGDRHGLRPQQAARCERQSVPGFEEPRLAHGGGGAVHAHTLVTGSRAEPAEGRGTGLRRAG